MIYPKVQRSCRPGDVLKAPPKILCAASEEKIRQMMFDGKLAIESVFGEYSKCAGQQAQQTHIFLKER